MIFFMNKFWRFISYFLRAKKCWSWPRHSKVLIYDAEGQEILLEYFQPWNPEVLHVRGEQINMRVLLASLLKSGRRAEAYVDCFIERVRPVLIVTFIDNSHRFYSLSVRNQNIKTLFIQNGIRTYYSDIFENLEYTGPEDHLRVDYMMTLGSRIGAEYAKRIKGAVVPMGSLKNNLVSRCHTKKTGTIAYVSQYRNNKGFFLGTKFYTFQDFFEQSDQLVLSFLVRYAKERDKELFIVPSSHFPDRNALEEEMRYFNGILGQTCTFSEVSNRYSSYNAVDSAEVTVAIDSTMGSESAARGNKVAIFSFRGNLLGVPARGYGWPETYPDEGPFWTNLPDPVVFERILDHIFAINDEQWQAELAEHGFNKIMVYDPGNSILQSVLKMELGEPNLEIT